MTRKETQCSNCANPLGYDKKTPLLYRKKSFLIERKDRAQVNLNLNLRFIWTASKKTEIILGFWVKSLWKKIIRSHKNQLKLSQSTEIKYYTEIVPIKQIWNLWRKQWRKSCLHSLLWSAARPICSPVNFIEKIIF